MLPRLVGRASPIRSDHGNGAGPRRRSGLARTPIRRGTSQLQRAPLQRRAPLRGATRLQPRTQAQAKAPRESRPAPVSLWPPDELRQLVLARAGYRCDRCGGDLERYGYSLQHRRARGAGGRRDRVLDTPWNLVVLCGSATTGCHGLVEFQEREAEGYARGFAIKGEARDPATVPIFRHLRYWVIPSVDDAEGVPLPSRGLWVPSDPLV